MTSKSFQSFRVPQHAFTHSRQSQKRPRTTDAEHQLRNQSICNWTYGPKSKHLPPEIRLLIAEQITEWHDHTAFRHTDRTNLRLLTNTLSVRKQFRLDKAEEAFLSAPELCTAEIWSAVAGKGLLPFLLEEADSNVLHQIRKSAYRGHSSGQIDPSDSVPITGEEREWLAFVYRNTQLSLVRSFRAVFDSDQSSYFKRSDWSVAKSDSPFSYVGPWHYFSMLKLREGCESRQEHYKGSVFASSIHTILGMTKVALRISKTGSFDLEEGSSERLNKSVLRFTVKEVDAILKELDTLDWANDGVIIKCLLYRATRIAKDLELLQTLSRFFALSSSLITSLGHLTSFLDISMEFHSTTTQLPKLFLEQQQVRTSSTEGIRLKPETDFLSLPCEIRLLIAEELTDWQDFMAFCHTDQTNYSLIKGKHIVVRKNFSPLIQEVEELGPALDTCVCTGDGVLAFLLREAQANQHIQNRRVPALEPTGLFNPSWQSDSQKETKWLDLVRRTTKYTTLAQILRALFDAESCYPCWNYGNHRDPNVAAYAYWATSNKIHRKGYPNTVFAHLIFRIMQMCWEAVTIGSVHLMTWARNWIKVEAALRSFVDYEASWVLNSLKELDFDKDGEGIAGLERRAAQLLSDVKLLRGLWPAICESYGTN
ncbi:hypothetical protein BJ508DRAFT_314775 [Ascobolus immersus RN42]|uniref:Uncharacterized protein n=1 Tax=Ascobolus immersus RN42 TaxID=1160509 RepID=A0A3N4HI52_ASCIM|nr:hypothetical protein BJ508DRAFT_314775 [Ascobolus immersus RN42]